jgi:hypothetical protein
MALRAAAVIFSAFATLLPPNFCTTRAKGTVSFLGREIVPDKEGWSHLRKMSLPLPGALPGQQFIRCVPGRKESKDPKGLQENLGVFAAPGYLVRKCF